MYHPNIYIFFNALLKSPGIFPRESGEICSYVYFKYSFVYPNHRMHSYYLFTLSTEAKKPTVAWFPYYIQTV